MWFLLGFACVLFTFAMGMFFALFLALMVNQAIRNEQLARKLRDLQKAPRATTIDEPCKSVQVEVVDDGNHP
jgi:hypothetical protein